LPVGPVGAGSLLPVGPVGAGSLLLVGRVGAGSLFAVSSRCSGVEVCPLRPRATQSLPVLARI
jgi:hypothetical protein